MKITEDAELAGTPEEVFDLRATEEFQEEKLTRSSPRAHSCSVQERGDHTIVTTTRSMATDSFPDAARRVVGSHITIHEVQDWGPPLPDGSRAAAIDITVEGVPVTLVGTLTVSPTATGSHQALRGDLKASIPFLGGKVESAAAPAISYGFDIEATLVNEWLAEDE